MCIRDSAQGAARRTVRAIDLELRQVVAADEHPAIGADGKAVRVALQGFAPRRPTAEQETVRVVPLDAATIFVQGVDRAVRADLDPQGPHVARVTARQRPVRHTRTVDPITADPRVTVVVKQHVHATERIDGHINAAPILVALDGPAIHQIAKGGVHEHLSLIHI